MCKMAKPMTEMPLRMHVIKHSPQDYFGVALPHKTPIIFAFQHRDHAQYIRQKIMRTKSINVEHKANRPGEFICKTRPNVPAWKFETKKINVQEIDTEEFLIEVGPQNLEISLIHDVFDRNRAETVMLRCLSIEPVLETDAILERLSAVYKL